MSGYSHDEPLSPLTIAVDATCPHCGEPIGLVVDVTVSRQRYVEDCPVCCRPIKVDYSAAGGQLSELCVMMENE